MFDTMTGVKIVGGFCGTFLVFLLGGWAAEAIYHVNIEAHGDEEREQAYVIEVPESGEGGGEEAAAEEVPFEELVAAADPADGEGVFRQCQACHNVAEEVNGVGPYLTDVVGRPIGSVEGYSYSSAMADHGGDWTPENLNAFLEDPQGWIPGTKMTFSGIRSAEDRAALIAYLDSFGS